MKYNSKIEEMRAYLEKHMKGIKKGADIENLKKENDDMKNKLQEYEELN